MKLKEAEALGERISPFLEDGEINQAYERLAPILAGRTRFPYLERIGRTFGDGPLEEVNPFLEKIANERTEGGWVVIGGALKAQLDRDFPGAFARCQKYIIAADVWYGADILGERVPGPGLLARFGEARRNLEDWRESPNAWVRRSVGVAVHFWAKRSGGEPDTIPHAQSLLKLLEPMFTEWEMNAAKGVGWGLKTLGKYYPDLIAEWLPEQLHHQHRAILVNKASAYLDEW